MIKGKFGVTGELDVDEERDESDEDVMLWAADAQY